MERFKWTPEPRPKFLVNGQVTGTADLPHAIQNRAFLYGDGFFESVRICYGKPQLVPFHWNRIQSSLRAHKMDASGWNLFHFELALHELCDANGIDEGGRIRLTFFRDGGGRYTPNTDKLCWIGEAEKLPHCEFVLNEQGLAVDVFPEMKKLQDPLANFKNISASIYVQAGLWAKEQALEDALLKNTGNHIIESTTIQLVFGEQRCAVHTRSRRRTCRRCNARCDHQLGVERRVQSLRMQHLTTGDAPCR